VRGAITHLYTGGASSSQGSILVASIKRSDMIKYIRTDIRTLSAGIKVFDVGRHQIEILHKIWSI
jgi:hypothetical protein